MSKEAMKLALEALGQCRYRSLLVDKIVDPAVTALREALAEQPAQQEPVIWMYVNKSTHETKFQKHMRDFVDHSLWSEVPLYGEPLANHELQCVCGAVWLGDEMVHLPDKHPPAQRTWVGLTDEEIDKLDCVHALWDDGESCTIMGIKDFAQAIEAKLREKNNG